MHLGLVIYGGLDQLSGGYLYDRKLVETLRRYGDNVQIISMPWSSYPGHLLHNLWPAWGASLVALDIDVLLQDELNHPSLFGLNASLRRQVNYPIVSIVHHLRSSEEHSAAAHWLYRRVERAYLRTVDGFIFNSQTTRAAATELRGGLEAPYVVASPAGDRFGPGMELETIAARARQGGPLRLLFVGNLIRRKGLHQLLAALGLIPQANWSLDVVGRLDVDPAYMREVRTQASAAGLEGNIRWLGPLNDASLEKRLRTSQVLVVPSSYEGFGIVYLEGMAFGLPAVASTAGAAGEIITHGLNGLLVSPADPAELAAELDQLYQDRPRLLALSLEARRRFEHFSSWDASMGSIRDFLIKISTRPQS